MAAAKKTSKTTKPAAVVTTPAATVDPRSRVPARTFALTSLAAAVGRAMTRCLELHGDGRLVVTQRQTFHRLGLRALRALDQIDGAWRDIITDSAVTMDQIDATTALADAANQALAAVVPVASANRLVKAAHVVTQALTLVEALVSSRQVAGTPTSPNGRKGRTAPSSR